MTQVNFYLLGENAQYYLCLCKLTEKIYKMAMKIAIFSTSQTELQMLDELLWQYRDDSFLPHEIYNPDEETVAPIVLGSDGQAFTQKNVLINLTESVPLFYHEFERIIEVVRNDTHLKQQSRNKYKYYQSQAVQIVTYTLN